MNDYDLDFSIEEISAKIKAHVESEEFDLESYVRTRSMPSETITIYLDEEAAGQLQRVNRALRLMTDEEILRNEEEYNKLIDLQAELEKLLAVTSLKVVLRGLRPEEYEDFQAAFVERFSKLHDSEGQVTNRKAYSQLVTERFSRYLLLHLVKISALDGSKEETRFEYEQVEAIARALPPSEWGRLDRAMDRLTFQNEALEEVINTDFLSRLSREGKTSE